MPVVCPIVTFNDADQLNDADELPHRKPVLVDEWVFAAWTPDASVGCLSGHRLVDGHAWYWSAVVQRGQPLLQLTEWEVELRPDRFVVKAPEMWAEHHCVEPMRQWSIGNEGYFVALDDPDEALGRAYGTPTPVSFDLEWYATAEPTTTDESNPGYAQVGVVHGQIELAAAMVELVEVPAQRWRRWSDTTALVPIPLAGAHAHTGLRAPFRFPDGFVADWVLTPDGFRQRHAPRPN